MRCPRVGAALTGGESVGRRLAVALCMLVRYRGIHVVCLICAQKLIEKTSD